MKITVYTITDCEFSREEKEYLTAHKLQFEEKNLETNKEFLTEMLAVSNNFAGTPVTKIEKDDGKIEVLKGFTKEDFDKAFGLAPAGEPPKGEEQKTEPATTAQPAPSASDAPPAPTPNPQPDTPANDPLNSILNDLQAKSNQTSSNQSFDSAQDKPADPAGPISTDSKPPPSPSIPDFPDKV